VPPASCHFIFDDFGYAFLLLLRRFPDAELLLFLLIAFFARFLRCLMLPFSFSWLISTRTATPAEEGEAISALRRFSISILFRYWLQAASFVAFSATPLSFDTLFDFHATILYFRSRRIALPKAD